MCPPQSPCLESPGAASPCPEGPPSRAHCGCHLQGSWRAAGVVLGTVGIRAAPRALVGGRQGGRGRNARVAADRVVLRGCGPSCPLQPLPLSSLSPGPPGSESHNQRLLPHSPNCPGGGEVRGAGSPQVPGSPPAGDFLLSLIRTRQEEAQGSSGLWQKWNPQGTQVQAGCLPHPSPNLNPHLETPTGQR